MNEVTKVHLGRQAFTISADAHHDLRKYLDAINKQVEDNEVVGEVELRMAELLAEHGVTGDKVILPKDVDFLKGQLGNPKDFKDDGDSTPKFSGSSETKQLFRDTDNAMIAGVASGLAAYFSLDVVLIRVLFVIGTIAWGGGVLIYVVLWLLVPEVRTTSDRLRMAGKSITVDTLNEVVERVDLKGAARRANSTLAAPINAAFRITLKVIGLGFILTGLCGLFGLIASAAYIALNSNQTLVDNIFPIGFREHLLLYVGMVTIGMISTFIVLFGMALFMQRWPIRTWVTGMLIGLVLVGAAIGGALAADVYPNIHDRYYANTHLVIRSLKPFTSVNVSGDGVSIDYQTSDKYYVSLSYYDSPNLDAVKTTVIDRTLQINSNQFNWHRNCRAICIRETYNVHLTVYSPDALQLVTPDASLPVIQKPYPLDQR